MRDESGDEIGGQLRTLKSELSNRLTATQSEIAAKRFPAGSAEWRCRSVAKTRLPLDRSRKLNDRLGAATYFFLKEIRICNQIVSCFSPRQE